MCAVYVCKVILICSGIRAACTKTLHNTCDRYDRIIQLRCSPNIATRITLKPSQDEGNGDVETIAEYGGHRCESSRLPELKVPATHQLNGRWDQDLTVQRE